MRICSSYGTPMRFQMRYDLEEIRMDVFDEIPDDVCERTIIKLCGRSGSIVPKSFTGFVDNDEMIIPGFKNIFSIHDFEKTPSYDDIVSSLSNNAEIVKGAFAVHSFDDLHNIYRASQSIKKKHVLIGMGETGKITRIRSSLLNNEFTYGFVCDQTASGQLSDDELNELGDVCKITGIIGSEINHTLSPAIHNAAMKKAGINGCYLIFDVRSLNSIKDVITEYSITGLNVTIPYKTDIMKHLDRCSPDAERIGAVNTITNKNGKLYGDNTDWKGIASALKDVDVKNALIVGTGGSARAAAYSLIDRGSDVSILGRNMKKAEQIHSDLETEIFSGKDVSSFDLIVNCTPIGMISDSEYPFDLNSISKEQTVLDLVYNKETDLVKRAKGIGCCVASGIDVLIGQGMESFRHWFGIEPDIESMRGAI